MLGTCFVRLGRVDALLPSHSRVFPPSRSQMELLLISAPYGKSWLVLDVLGRSGSSL